VICPAIRAFRKTFSTRINNVLQQHPPGPNPSICGSRPAPARRLMRLPPAIRRLTRPTSSLPGLRVLLCRVRNLYKQKNVFSAANKNRRKLGCHGCGGIGMAFIPCTHNTTTRMAVPRTAMNPSSHGSGSSRGPGSGSGGRRRTTPRAVGGARST
jgi:hypothetical protein